MQKGRRQGESLDPLCSLRGKVVRRLLVSDLAERADDVLRGGAQKLVGAAEEGRRGRLDPMLRGEHQQARQHGVQAEDVDDGLQCGTMDGVAQPPRSDAVRACSGTLQCRAGRKRLGHPSPVRVKSCGPPLGEHHRRYVGQREPRCALGVVGDNHIFVVRDRHAQHLQQPRDECERCAKVLRREWLDARRLDTAQGLGKTNMRGPASRGFSELFSSLALARRLWF